MIKYLSILLVLLSFLNLNAQDSNVNLRGKTKAQASGIVSGVTVPNKAFFEDQLFQPVVDFADAITGRGYNSSMFDSLGAAITQCETDSVNLIIDRAETINANITIADHVIVHFVGRGRINHTGFTVDMGYVVANEYQRLFYTTDTLTSDTTQFVTIKNPVQHAYWFGAIPNDGVGDQHQLQALISSVAIVNGVAQLGYGEYETHNPLYIWERTMTLAGRGRAATIISWPADQGEDITNQETGYIAAGVSVKIYIGENANGTVIKDLKLQGPYTPPNTSGKTIGIGIDGADNCIIENVHVNGANWSGIWPFGQIADTSSTDLSYHTIINNCISDSNGIDGVEISLNSYGTKITNSVFRGNGMSPAGGAGVENISKHTQISQCYFDTNKVNITSTGSYGIYTNNIFKDAQVRHISITPSVANPAFTGVTGLGFIISNNLFTNENTKTAAINIGTNSKWIVVTGNNFHNIETAIVVADTTKYITIAGNNSTDSTSVFGSVLGGGQDRIFWGANIGIISGADSTGVIGNINNFSSPIGTRFTKGITVDDAQRINMDDSGNKYFVTDGSTDIRLTNANLELNTAGRTLKLSQAANGASGVATLSSGTVTVNTTAIASGDEVILSRQGAGSNPGFISLGTITDGTSFVINSSNASDDGTVYWEIRKPSN